MLLNKIPCLDKGFVAFVSSDNNGDKLKSMALEYLQSQDTAGVLHLANLTLIIKCPLFVQLNLSKFKLNVVSAIPREVDSYCPNAGEIGGTDRATNELIADDLMRTSEALLINPKAYRTDGCDKFMSQILTPISTYTTLIVGGPYNEWKRFCSQAGAPAPVQSYMDGVQQILSMEWR